MGVYYSSNQIELPLIDEKDYEAYRAFISHDITPETINSVLEYTHYHNIDNMIMFILNHSKPTLAKYNIHEPKKHQLSMPIFLTRLINIRTLCTLNLYTWLEFYLEIINSDDKEKYILQADTEDQDYLRHIIDNRIGINVGALVTCVEHNSIECLKLLVNNGCPMSTCVCAMAAKYGRYDMLRFLHYSKCPWDSSTVMLANQYKQRKCFAYAIKHGCL